MWSWLLLRLPLVPSCCADWIAEWQKTPCAANPRVEVLSMFDNSANNTLKITFMKTLQELANRVIMSQNIESLCFQRQPQFHRILSSRWGQQTCKMPGCRRRCWAATRWIFFLTTGVPGWNKIQHMLLAWCCGYKTARTHCTKRLTNPSQRPDPRECTQWPCKLPLHDSHCNMQMHTALYGKTHEGFMAGWLLSIESCYINQTSVSRKLTEKRKIRRMQVPQRPPLYPLGHSTLGWGRV